MIPLVLAYLAFVSRGMGRDFRYRNLVHNLDCLGATISLEPLELPD